MNKRAVVWPGAENWLVELHELREPLVPLAAARAAVLLQLRFAATLRTARNIV